MSAKPRGVPLYNTSEMEHLRKLADGQGEEIALLHGENRELRGEIKRLRAAAQRVMKAYAGNDWGEQMKAIGALSDALCPPGGIRNDFDV